MSYQQNDKFIRTLCIVLVIFALAATSIRLVKRMLLEGQNKTVEIVLDYNDMLDLCRAVNMTADEVAALFKKAGVTSIALSEVTLDSLQEEGLIRWTTGSALLSMYEIAGKVKPDKIKPGSVYISGFSGETEKMLLENLGILTEPGCFSLIDSVEKTIEINGNVREISTKSIGFDKNLARHLHDAGFYIVLRPENRISMEAKSVKHYMDILESMPGISAIVFGGENEVLGYPQNLNIVADAFRQGSAAFGDIEAPNDKAKQKGAQFIALKVPASTIRVQSISKQYMVKMKPENAVDMFRLGVRERNIRMLYLRPFQSAIDGRNLLETNLYYVSMLKNELEKYGFTTGRASRFPDTRPGVASVVLITLGCAALLLLLLSYFMDIHTAVMYSILAAAVIFSVGFIGMGKLYLVQKIIALAIGVITPVFAFTYVLEDIRKIKDNGSTSSAMFFAIMSLMKATFITLAGGLTIAALLSSVDFLVAANRFSGVKVVLVVPPVIALIIFFLKTMENGKSLQDLLSRPILIWQALILGVLAGVGAVYLIRSGNSSDTVASDGERQLRVALEQLLWVRPRFKEFMIGHPAMILTWGLLYRGILSGTSLAVLFGMIGQADIIDTFCHIHTPVLISLVRVLNGIGGGMIIGITLLLIWLKTAGKK